MTSDRGEVQRSHRPYLHPGLMIMWFGLAFAVRLAFGLMSDFWGEDEHQIYLIGLKFFTTGEWPYYGPDVVYTQTRIAGALQGLLVGGPLWLIQQPEAPYLLLNMLSFGALLLLGQYIRRRLPGLPAWWLWLTIFFSPWTLDLSTHVYNPSYVLTGAVLFFVGVLELTPALRVGYLSRAVAAFCVGFGVLWVEQLHLAASLLMPIAAIALVLQWRSKPRRALVITAACVAGAVLAGATLIPTLLAVGPGAVAGSTSANVVFEPRHLLRLPEVIGQVLSLATVELPRFLGSNTEDRLAFLIRYWWAAPAIVVAVIGGTLETVYLAVCLCLRSGRPAGWVPVRNAVIGLLMFVYAAYAFSIRPPASHAVYVLMPAAMIYAAYCWEPLLRVRPWRIAAMVLIICNAIAHAAIASRNFTDRSLYTRRALVERAIVEKNYHLVGERRSDSW